MKLIERYILRRATGMFLATLLPLMAIVWTTQALANVNLVTDSGQSTLAFLRLATLILPSIIPIILPFALVIGVAQTLTAMNSDSELTVLNAAGSSRMTIIRPILYLGVALSILSFAVDNFVEPYSRMAVRKMIATAHADLLSSVVQENTFRKIADGLYVQVASRRNGGVLHGIFVADSRDPAYELVYYAREGAVDENGTALVMKDGEVHRKLPDSNVSIIKFDSYAFDLTDLTKMAGEATVRAKDRDLFFLLNPDPKDAVYEKNPMSFEAELHRRLTEWTFPLLFALIALVVSGDARSHREARMHPMITALLTCLFIRWATFYAGNSAEESRVFIPIMYLIPLATGYLAVRQLVGNKRLEIPLTLAQKVDEVWTRLGLGKAAPASDGEPAPMMFTTLGRYFFWRYTVTTFWFLAGIFALIFIIDFSELSNRMSQLPRYSLAGALLMTTFRIPMILQQTVPFVALFAGMAALISLNRRYELVVTRAAGISVWQFLQPFVIGAFLFGVLTVIALNPLAAWGTKQAEALEADWGSSSSSASAISIPWLRQIYGSDDSIIGARSVQDEGKTLVNVTVIHFDPQGTIVSRQDAATAKLEDGYWLLNGVTETRNGELPRRLATAQLPTHLKPEFVQETLSKADSIQFFDLPHKIEVAKSFGFPTNGMETQFHSMLSLPLLLVAMTLIAASVSLKFSRFNQSRPVILGGILSGFVLYVVTVLVKAFGSSGIVPPFVAAWLPVVVAMALGSTILLHEEDG